MIRAFILVIVALILIIGGLMGANGAILILALPAILTLSAGVFFASDTTHLVANRWLSAEKMTTNDALAVEVNITNNGADIAELHIQDTLHPHLTLIEGEASLITPLKAGETATLSYLVRGPRGNYEFPNLQIGATDRFGLFWRRLNLQVLGKTKTTIIPQVNRIGQIAIRPRVTRSYAGYIPARIAGSGTNFFGVREYRPGDSLRHLNWKAAARHDHANQLFTNEFEQDRIADVGLIVDARRRGVHFAGDDGILEFNITAASAFAESFLSDGNRVSLLVYGNYINWTVPGYGRAQKQRILQTLSQITVGTSAVFDHLTYFPKRLFPAKSQLVVFSTVLEDDIEYLRRLRGQGYSVLIVSPDAVAYEASLLPDIHYNNTGQRIARIERELLLRKLRQAGIQVVNWNTELPIADLVETQLSNPMVSQGGVFR